MWSYVIFCIFVSTREMLVDNISQPLQHNGGAFFIELLKVFHAVKFLSNRFAKIISFVIVRFQRVFSAMANVVQLSNKRHQVRVLVELFLPFTDFDNFSENEKVNVLALSLRVDI